MGLMIKFVDGVGDMNTVIFPRICLLFVIFLISACGDSSETTTYLLWKLPEGNESGREWSTGGLTTYKIVSGSQIVSQIGSMPPTLYDNCAVLDIERGHKYP